MDFVPNAFRWSAIISSLKLSHEIPSSVTNRRPVALAYMTADLQAIAVTAIFRLSVIFLMHAKPRKRFNSHSR
jgi:hypothetical protein